jgi:hypothetical protein
MQAISRFVRITILGGVLFLTPIVVILLILSKAYSLASDNHSGIGDSIDRARLLSCGALRTDKAGPADCERA